MPVWGLGLALVALVAAAAIAIPAALSTPARTSASEPLPVPSMFVPEKKPVAAFIGDSYTAGTGGTDGGFVKLVAAEQGWFPKNFGRGSTGFLPRDLSPELSRDACGQDYCESYGEMIEKATAAKPDVIVVSGGRNNAGDDPDAVRDSIEGFFTALRQAAPDARVIVTSPLWDTREAPSSLSDIAAWEKDAANAIAAEYVDLGQPLEGQDGLITDDGVHPNDAGYEAIAAAINAALAG